MSTSSSAVLRAADRVAPVTLGCARNNVDFEEFTGRITWWSWASQALRADASVLIQGANVRVGDLVYARVIDSQEVDLVPEMLSITNPALFS